MFSNTVDTIIAAGCGVALATLIYQLAKQAAYFILGRGEDN